MGMSLLISFNTFAQSPGQLDLLSICQGKQSEKEVPPSAKPSVKFMKIDQQELVIVDQGFCTEFLKQQSELKVGETVSILGLDVNPTISTNCPSVTAPTPVIAAKDKWKIRFYASHSFTTYFNTDVTFQSSRYNVVIKDYEWAERSSREFFSPATWKEEGNNPFQMIDEPSNTFTVSLEKNGHEFFISAFHPKFLQAADQVKYMKGTIDGVEVDGYAPVNKPFDGYNQEPGESELVRNQNTHKQMTFEIGYGHRFKLLDSKVGSISWVPSLGLGVMVGENYSVMIKEDAWWDFEEGKDPYGVQGIGGSITNRLEFNTKKERFGVFYENKLGYYHQDHGFMDGTQKYNLGFLGNSVGMKFMIHNPNNKKSTAPLF
jgi:hypothetical protein